MKNTNQPNSRGGVIARLIAAALLAVGMIAAPVTAGTAANADTPDTPFGTFTADECVGTTWEDPAAAEWPFENLLQIEGSRLDAYNDGHVVPMYDAGGGNESVIDGGGYPPVCGVRYDAATQSSISEWMFCTDYTSLVCAGTNENGDLVDRDGNVVGWPEEQPDGNEKLTPEEEAMIVALINGSWEYDGQASFNYSESGVRVTEARTDSTSTSGQRIALQVMIWCLTDPPAENPTGLEGDKLQSELDRYATCAATMTPELRATLLASVPENATLSLNASDSSLTVDDTAEFTLETSVLHRPIELAVTGAAGTLAVKSGPATLSGTTLTVTGAGPVLLTITGTEPGNVTLSAETQTLSREHLAWHQPQSRQVKPCQIFATMFSAPDTLADSDSVTFAAGPGPSISSSLVDSADDDRVLPWTGGTAIDTISYENLTPGTEYTVSGELMQKDPESGTGTETGIVGSTTFTPTSASGTVSVTFVVPKGYAGTTLIAFQRLYEGTDTAADPVATHEDINAASQTITVEQKPKAEKPDTEKPEVDSSERSNDSLANTGGALPWIGIGAAGLLVLVGAALIVACRKHSE